MKEHIQAEMVNDLLALAIRFHSHECLRELISKCVAHYLVKNRNYPFTADMVNPVKHYLEQEIKELPYKKPSEVLITAASIIEAHRRWVAAGCPQSIPLSDFEEQKP